MQQSERRASAASLPLISKFRPLIIDRYFFREFVTAFVAVMAFCALLLLVASIFDKFEDILENDPPLRVILLYFGTSMPFKLMQIVPMATLLAVLFSIGNLARNNEILALMTSGVHTLRIAAPLIFGGILISISSLFLNEVVVPPLEEASRVHEQKLEGKDVAREAREKNVFARGRGERFYLMRIYDSQENVMIRPMVVDMTKDYSGLRRRIEAERARFVRDDEENRKSEWVFSKPRIWEFNERGKLLSFKNYNSDVPVTLEENLTALLSQKKDPEEMGFFELREYVGLLTERGQPAYRYRTNLMLKVTFPLGILILMVVGFSYAVRTRAGTAMALFGMSVLWGFFYYGFNALMRALGQAGSVPPIMAGLIPIAVFFVLAVWFLRRSSRWYA